MYCSCLLSNQHEKISSLFNFQASVFSLHANKITENTGKELAWISPKTMWSA